jgi:O-antigen/teichoic acid export membrane protein
VLALYILLFFQDIIQAVFEIHRVSRVGFYIFAQIIPGLLFFSAVVSQTPVYEADGRVVLLQRNILMVVAINLCLNLFCIPFAGFFGAAFATTASMFAYFMLFGRNLAPILKIHKMNYIIAGAGVYLAFIFFQTLDPGFYVTFFSVPVFLFVFLTLTGFFDVGQENDLRLDALIRLTREIGSKPVQPQTGGFDDGRQ